MFVSQQLVVQVSFEAARARLVNLADHGRLRRASEDAYESGIDHLIRVGPLGAKPGASKLVRVSFLDPVYRADAMTMGLRWEATGLTGGLFPVLDADLSVRQGDESTTRLELTGSYRPPLGGLGAGLDRAILGKVAVATIRALLGDIAGSLAGDEPAAEPHQDTASDLARPYRAGPDVEPG